MSSVTWFLILGIFAGLAFWLWRVRQNWLERRDAAAARMAEFVTSTKGPAPSAPAVPVSSPAPEPSLPQQKLLFDAAAKAGEAGEPALSIQLYARLLARYPDTGLAALARAAVEAQKKNLSKG